MLYENTDLRIEGRIIVRIAHLLCTSPLPSALHLVASLMVWFVVFISFIDFLLIFIY